MALTLRAPVFESAVWGGKGGILEPLNPDPLGWEHLSHLAVPLPGGISLQRPGQECLC